MLMPQDMADIFAQNCHVLLDTETIVLSLRWLPTLVHADTEALV